jgi:hypothetical protein
MSKRGRASAQPLKLNSRLLGKKHTSRFPEAVSHCAQIVCRKVKMLSQAVYTEKFGTVPAHKLLM